MSRREGHTWIYYPQINDCARFSNTYTKIGAKSTIYFTAGQTFKKKNLFDLNYMFRVASLC